MLAAWVDGTLAEDDRRGIEEHVSRCQDCYFVVRETATAAAESQPPRARPRPWALRALPIAAVLVLGVGGFALWRQVHPADPYARAVGPLVEAVGERRFFEPRLTGGFKYGPMVSPTRSSDAQNREKWEVHGVAGKLEAAALERSSAENVQALAAAELLSDKLDDAIRRLESLTAQDPASAQALSDLAAAYLVRAAQPEHTDDYAHALEKASTALRHDPRLAEALFNRALALEGLGLTAQAIQAWQDYLAVDGTTDWAGVARKRLVGLQRAASDSPGPDAEALAAGVRAFDAAAVDEALKPSTTMAREAFLTRWLLPAAMATDAEEHARLLAEARFLATRLREATGDRFAEGSVAALPPGPHPSVAGACRSFQAAEAAFEQGLWAQAMKHYRAASLTLHANGSPLALYADVHIAVISARSAGPSQQQGRLEQLRARARAGRFRHLEGRCAWGLGVSASQQGRPDRAAVHYAEALEAFHATRDQEARVFAESLLSGALEQLGDANQSWQQRIHAVNDIGQVSRRGYRMGILLGATSWAVESDLLETALAFNQAALAEADKHRLAYQIAETLFMRSRIMARLGRSADAVSDLDRGRQWLAQVRDPLVATRLVAEQGEVQALLAEQPADALSALGQASGAFRARGDPGRQAALQLEQGRWLVRAGRLDEAEAAFLQGTHFYERRSIAERWSTGRRARAWPLYDELLRLRIHRGDGALATLAAADTARERFYRVRTDDGQLYSLLQNLPERLGPGRAVVVYAYLPPSVHAWVLTDAGAGRFLLSANAVAVERMVDDLEGCAERPHRDGGRQEELLSDLYDALVAPLRHRFEGKQHIGIVPHRALARVPWPALRDRSSGARLLEGATITVAPTVSLLTGQDHRPDVRPLQHALFLAGGGARSSGLPDLPGSVAEATRLASATGSEFAIASGLTPEELLKRVEDVTLLHFSGHALVNERYPAYSALVLGPDRRGQAVRLLAYRLAEQRWRKSPVVVLAACRGAVGRSTGNEGVVHLARAFLVGGASQVVAHLWSLDDTASVSIMTRLYQGLSAGLDAPEALRRAQLASLRDPDRAVASAAAGFLVWGSWPVSQRSER